MDEATNRTLTQVGAGTPMGGLLRRYWHPVAAVAELEDRPVKPLRLLADLALYAIAPATTGSSTGTARTAAPTSRAASSRSAGCAATITAGATTTPAPASSSRTRTPPIPARATGSASG
jgi:hypothetical protein